MLRLTHTLIIFATLMMSVQTSSAKAPEKNTRSDLHSYANPQHVRMTHLDLTFEVDFVRQVLKGMAVLTVARTSNDKTQPLILDTRDLRIESAEASQDGKTYEKIKYVLAMPEAYLGSKLTLEIPQKIRKVRITYTTSPKASGLQWLDREQTASKRHPFLFTQSQAIHARSWIPLQDTPAVRVTYNATVKTEKDLFAVMSASNARKKNKTGVYRFRMKQPIPAYLIALAVGDLTFKPVGKRTGVYAEPPVIDKAVKEFEDMEAMLEAVEKMYGPYRWERYDVLVLPPSFPFGGMENPRLTFATPTILAGDKSLVALISHEMAHSWSGNLVTNATWRDFWLNEGFTVYLERRIQEAIYGEKRATMEAVLGRQKLSANMKQLAPRDQILHVDLAGRDPDEGFTYVPYEKGALFLRHLETVFGREKFDAFLKSYFNRFGFKSITTGDFVNYLQKELLAKNPELAKKVPIDEWIYEPGIPKSAPKLSAEALTKVESEAKQWVAGKLATDKLSAKSWSTQEWLHFLRNLPKDLGQKRMADLDKTFSLTKVGNSEILFQWLMLSIQNDYSPAHPRLEKFLTSMGRRKFLQPLFEELAKTEAGKKRAQRIYKKARATYHPIAQVSIDKVLKWNKKQE